MSRTGVKFRPLDRSNSSEIGFVYKSWLQSFKAYADGVPYSEYRDTYQAYLDRIIQRDRCGVMLAVHPQHTDQIFGFICYELERPIVHYMYVKGDYRRTGVGSDLLEEVLVTDTGSFDYTFNTRLGRNFLNKRSGRYRPKHARNDLP